MKGAASWPWRDSGIASRPLAIALTLLLTAALSAQDSRAERAARWREDLSVLAEQLPARHIDPFTVLSRRDFDARVKQLDARLGEFDDLTAQFELARLVAALGDSHTALQADELYKGSTLPFGFLALRDGVWCLLAPKENASCAGQKLVKVGGQDLVELRRLAATLFVFDNESAWKARVGSLVTMPRLLWLLGLAKSDAEVELTFAGSDGKETTVVAAPGIRQRDSAIVRPDSPPITAFRRDKWFDKSFVEDAGLLYIQFNRCATSKENDLDAFIASVEKVLSGGGVKAVALDLQYNGGGDSRRGDALIAALARHAPVNGKKNVFGVIGRGTFSSAILNASTLKSSCGGVLVGEPSSGSPNHFGELKNFVLPRSRLVVHYSTKRFALGPKGSTALVPDHLAEPTFEDYKSGRDVILEKIRALIQP